MHWASHGHTAAEVIYQRADVEIAKNYLNIDDYLKMTRRDILETKGIVTHSQAVKELEQISALDN